MSVGFILLCAAAAAIIAAGASLVVGSVLRLARRWLRGRTPAAKARLLFAAAVLPAVATIVVMTAALSPALGWIADHCHDGGDPHGHPHICEHFSGQLPAIPIVVIAALFGARMLTTLVSAFALTVSAWRAKALLSRTATASTAERPPDALVLPIDAPRAFVVGLFRPQVFVTRGLLSPSAREHLAAVVAHEEAHVRRGDPVWRVVANIALAFHLPGVAAYVRHSLAGAQEMAADERAAEVVGSREQVASALVFVARHADGTAPRAAHAFGPAYGSRGRASDLESRVRALLEDPPGIDTPSKRTLAILAAAFVVAVACGAGLVHHGVEIVLGLLSH